MKMVDFRSDKSGPIHFSFLDSFTVHFWVDLETIILTCCSKIYPLSFPVVIDQRDGHIKKFKSQSELKFKIATSTHDSSSKRSPGSAIDFKIRTF
jgi:hypothetical protein